MVTGTLEDSEAARDFASLLPLSLTLEDYAATEKLSDLQKPLSTSGAPAGITAKVGDLAYYAPWGNFAIFHKNFHYSSDLVRLGTQRTLASPRIVRGYHPQARALTETPGR